MLFDLLRYLMEDAELCACKFIRQGRMFVMINFALPLSKQIFLAAHELYHFYCHLEEKDVALLQSGSILESDVGSKAFSLKKKQYAISMNPEKHLKKIMNL